LLYGHNPEQKQSLVNAYNQQYITCIHLWFSGPDVQDKLAVLPWFLAKLLGTSIFLVISIVVVVVVVVIVRPLEGLLEVLEPSQDLV
jgi:hypothetical protein